MMMYSEKDFATVEGLVRMGYPRESAERAVKNGDADSGQRPGLPMSERDMYEALMLRMADVLDELRGIHGIKFREMIEAQRR